MGFDYYIKDIMVITMKDGTKNEIVMEVSKAYFDDSIDYFQSVEEYFQYRQKQSSITVFDIDNPYNNDISEIHPKYLHFINKNNISRSQITKIISFVICHEKY